MSDTRFGRWAPGCHCIRMPTSNGSAFEVFRVVMSIDDPCFSIACAGCSFYAVSREKHPP